MTAKDNDELLVTARAIRDGVNKCSQALAGYDIPTVMTVLGVLVQRGLKTWPEEEREYIFEGHRAHVFGERFD